MARLSARPGSALAITALSLHLTLGECSADAAQPAQQRFSSLLGATASADWLWETQPERRLSAGHTRSLAVGAAQNWALGPFGDCSNYCQTPVKTRSLECRSAEDNQLLLDSSCSHRPRPPTSSPCSCELQACSRIPMNCNVLNAELPALPVISEYEVIGCFERLPSDVNVTQCFEGKEAMRDDGCLYWKGTDPCRSGLPFYRNCDATTLESCSAFCRCKGLDVMAIVEEKECRCGASRLLTQIWHRSEPLPKLLFSISKLERASPGTCPVLVARYPGHYQAGGLSPEEKRCTNLRDTAHVDTLVADRLITPMDEEHPLNEGVAANHHAHHEHPVVAQAQGPDHEVKAAETVTVPPMWDRPCWPGHCGPGNGPWPDRQSSAPAGVTDNFQEYVLVKYTWSDGVSNEAVEAVDETRKEGFRQAVTAWHTDTCIVLEETVAPTGQYIEVGVYDTQGCWLTPMGASVARLNLGWCNSATYLGNMIHEIGHALGMNHEMKRADGQAEYHGHGPFLHMYWDNLDPGRWSQYETEEDSYVGSAYDGPGDPQVGYAAYDFDSIMHYPASTYFDTFPDTKKDDTGQRAGLSPGDITQIFDQYQCRTKSQPAIALAPAPTTLRVSGVCAYRSHLDGDYTLVGYTHSGAPYYKQDTSSFGYLYWDPECGSGIQSAWIFDSTAPNTALEKDLDGDGVCSMYGYSANTYSGHPPLGDHIWRFYCGASWDDIWFNLVATDTTSTTTATNTTTTATNITSTVTTAPNTNTTTTATVTATNTTTVTATTLTTSTITNTSTATNTTTVTATTRTTSVTSTITNTSTATNTTTVTATTKTTHTTLTSTITNTSTATNTTTVTATTATTYTITVTLTATNTTAATTNTIMASTTTTATATSTTEHTTATTRTTTVTTNTETTTASTTTNTLATTNTETTTASTTTNTLATTNTETTTASTTTSTMGTTTLTTAVTTNTETTTASTTTNTMSTTTRTTASTTTTTATVSTASTTTMTATSVSTTATTMTTATDTTATMSTSTTSTASTTFSTNTPTTSLTTTASRTSSSSVTVTEKGGEPPATATVLARQAEAAESAALSTFLEGSANSSVSKVGSLTLVAAKIDSSSSSVVAVEGTEVEISLPSSLLSSLGLEGAVITVTSFSADSTASMSTGNDEVKASVSINLYSSDGVLIDVSGLTEPIQITLSTGGGVVQGEQCAYWNEATSVWITEGLELNQEALAEGSVVCETKHLTLFASIVRSYECSQLKLLSEEGLSGLRGGGWQSSRAAWCFWGVLICLASLMVIGALLDCRRRSDFRDEDFLIEFESEPTNGEGGKKRGCIAALWALVATCICNCVLMDVFAEVLSSWCGHIGDLRDLCGGLLGGVQMVCGGRGGALVYDIMSGTVDSSAWRQASASAGISRDSSKFLLRSAETKQMMLSNHARTAAQNSNAASTRDGAPTMRLSTGSSGDRLQSLDNLGKLHKLVALHLGRHLLSTARWGSLPGSVCRLFLCQNPVGSCLLRSVFLTSTLRVVLFMVNVIGALMLCTVFFQATGSLSRRALQSVCAPPEDSAGQMGRLFVVGLGAFFISVLPSIVLNSLCTRSIKTFDYKGCPGWGRQLRTWRGQDALIWVLALAYLGFSIFFILLFLANVSDQDQDVWIKSGAVSIVLNTIVVPFCISLIVPLSAMVSLSIASGVNKVEKRKLINEKLVKVQREHENLNSPRVHV